MVYPHVFSVHPTLNILILSMRLSLLDENKLRFGLCNLRVCVLFFFFFVFSRLASKVLRIMSTGTGQEIKVLCREIAVWKTDLVNSVFRSISLEKSQPGPFTGLKRSERSLC